MVCASRTIEDMLENHDRMVSTTCIFKKVLA